MRNFTPQTHVLPLSQRHLWAALANSASLGFTLYGGTAIALRLGYRSSVDFDIFQINLVIAVQS